MRLILLRQADRAKLGGMARTTWIVAAASSAVTAIVVGGVAWSASAPSKAVYTGCVDGHRVLHTVVASTGKCASGEKSTVWVAQGPRHVELVVPQDGPVDMSSCGKGWQFLQGCNEGQQPTPYAQSESVAIDPGT